MGKAWTLQEDNLILEKYKNLGADGLSSFFPNRTVAAIHQRASFLGVHKKNVKEKTCDEVVIKTAKSEYQRLSHLSELFNDNDKNLNNLIKWKDTLQNILSLLEIGDRIFFGSGVFEMTKSGLYCRRGVGSFISRDEMYPGLTYPLQNFVATAFDINRVLENWGRECYYCNIDVGYLRNKREKYLEEERNSEQHKGRIEGTPNERAKEASFRIENQIDGYVENVIRRENYTEVYTVEGGSQHIRYLVYDAGDIYVK